MRFINSLAGILLAFSTTTLAQEQKPTEPKPLVNKTGIQFRAESTGTQTQVGSGPKATQQAFVLKTARMIMSGDVTDNTTYTLRLDVKSALYGEAGTDTSITALDRAYIEQRFGAVSVRIGRLPITALSIENDYSSMDRYYESNITYTVAYTLLPITTGISASYAVAGQTFSIDAFNGYTETVSGITKGNQQGGNMSLALSWRGNIAGIAKPIVSYDRISRVRNGAQGSPQRDEKVEFTTLGVGSQFSFAGVDLDLEYDQLNKPKFKSYTFDATKKEALENTNAETKMTGVITQVAYNVTSLGLRPFIKGSQDKTKTDGKDSFKSTRGNLGLEFRPSTRPFRYHAVVVNQSDDDTKGTPTSKKKTTKYIVGVAAKI